MSPLLAADLLAQLPETTYINPWKLAAMAVAFVIWALFAQWVDKDTVAVNTFRIIWNLVFLGVGVVALPLMLFVPQFAIGYSVYWVMVLGVVIAYVVHRNGLVEEEDKVFTPAHIQRLMTEGFKGKKKDAKEVKERVRLTGPDKKVVAIPVDEILREQYRLTQDLLFDALWRRASVVEIVPAGQVTRVTYLVDGIPAEREKMVRAEADAIVMFLKRTAGLNLEERRKPQAGKLMAAVGDNKMDLAVRTDGSTAGEKLVLRVIAGEKNYKVKDLGFTSQQLETVNAFMHAPRGLILLTAPPTSGLTTTVYSFTRSHDAFLQNIQTLEYQKELDLDNVTQHVFTPAGDKTFQADLQKVVRTDPDVIVLPEVRDHAVASLAAEAASEKQKVYVAIPAQDLFEGFRRWIKLVADNGLAAKSQLVVINQRLVRKLCSECKQPYKPDPAVLKKMNMPADKVFYRPPEPQYDKHGNPIICQNCQGTGYFGRTGIFEMLLVDDALREVIRRAKSFSEIQSQAQKAGSLDIKQQGLHKVFDGTTSIQEIQRATKPPASPAAPAGEPGAAPAAAVARPKPDAGGAAAKAAR